MEKLFNDQNIYWQLLSYLFIWTSTIYIPANGHHMAKSASACKHEKKAVEVL